MPAKWRFKGRITWRGRVIPPEAIPAFKITDPEGHTTVELFPKINCFWSDDQNQRTPYALRGWEIKRPMKAVESIQKIYIPRFRKGIKNPEVLKSEAMPEAAEAARTIREHHEKVSRELFPSQPSCSVQSEAARIKLSYEQEGTPFIEEVYATVTYCISSVPGSTGGEMLPLVDRSSVFSPAL